MDNKNLLIFLTILIILIFCFNYNFKSNGYYYNTLLEMIKFNYILYHISSAGLIDIKEKETHTLERRSNDPLLIKHHRKMEAKYGKMVATYVGLDRNYYILDVDLAKSILNDSPKLFSSGNIKENIFKKFMPLNLGIAKCLSNKKCPWQKLRNFNENALGTNYHNDFFFCIEDIVKTSINKAPLNVDDFKALAFDITNKSIFGNIKNQHHLKIFLENFNKSDNVKSLPFYQEYQKDLHKSYQQGGLCSLAHYARLYNETLTQDELDDQIPHWFGPFLFMISYLIPGLLCLILNIDSVYNKLINEINDPGFNLYTKDSYLHYCVIEHLRLFNTININIQRTVNQNMKYKDINFKKGDQLFILHSSILRNSRQFPNPDSFIPERWNNSQTHQQDIVFGTGPQICVSKNITPVYYKIIIYYLLKTFKYDPSNVLPKVSQHELYAINPFKIALSIE